MARVLSPERLSGVAPVTGVIDLAAIDEVRRAEEGAASGLPRSEADLT